MTIVVMDENSINRTPMGDLKVTVLIDQTGPKYPFDQMPGLLSAYRVTADQLTELYVTQCLALGRQCSPPSIDQDVLAYVNDWLSRQRDTALAVAESMRRYRQTKLGQWGLPIGLIRPWDEELARQSLSATFSYATPAAINEMLDQGRRDWPVTEGKNVISSILKKPMSARTQQEADFIAYLAEGARQEAIKDAQKELQAIYAARDTRQQNSPLVGLIGLTDISPSGLEERQRAVEARLSDLLLNPPKASEITTAVLGDYLSKIVGQRQ
ncbi:hypothetical protein IC614_00005 [Allosphingosinicella flava]|uniref:Uncharacterized protein n=1 Tax=Allosphingosinicella flava TaxID=2771430 RepID=A0A7T2GJL4_9SPHN|nr:hypothetical protein IC614_00005 [Sphingosinicella flava]